MYTNTFLFLSVTFFQKFRVPESCFGKLGKYVIEITVWIKQRFRDKESECFKKE